MRDQRNSRPADEPPTHDVLEHGVLHLVLRRHPAQLTVEEIVRAVGENPIVVKDAITELVADGLLHRHGDFVAPSRAAVRFDELGT
ncbi:MAG TPA: hypothetical protein VGW75_06780 [Solirubrobacteraceae bacterium]|jgi:DNA-binding IclR family transcriptional regulator|nr:hypothetical protein [Solirubrobacteraceae bacterium]